MNGLSLNQSDLCITFVGTERCALIDIHILELLFSLSLLSLEVYFMTFISYVINICGKTDFVKPRMHFAAVN